MRALCTVLSVYLLSSTPASGVGVGVCIWCTFCHSFGIAFVQNCFGFIQRCESIKSHELLYLLCVCMCERAKLEAQKLDKTRPSLLTSACVEFVFSFALVFSASFFRRFWLTFSPTHTHTYTYTPPLKKSISKLAQTYF